MSESHDLIKELKRQLKLSGLHYEEGRKRKAFMESYLEQLRQEVEG